MDSLWIFLGLLAAAALAAVIWRIKTLRIGSPALESLYARRQGLVVELLKVADSPNRDIARVLDKLTTLERQLSTAPKLNRPPIESALTAALNELYALADHDDDLMTNHDYVLVQAHLAEIERNIETRRGS